MTELKLEPFGKMPDGRNIDLYTLTNEHGTRVAVTTYGARLVRFEKDVQGHPVDIVLGYTRGEDYVRDTAYMGAVIGRHANRIAGGRITVGGRPYLLELNSGSKKQNHIHGGAHGLHTHLFDADIVHDGVRFTTVSPDGTGGFPGNLEVKVTYTLTGDDALSIRYEAISDAETICNITNHSYFNLEGCTAPSILDHTAEIYADTFTWADAESLPDGRILPVAGTPMDFTTPRRIGDRIDADYDEVQMAHGYDHNWVLRGDFAPEPYSHLKKAARVAAPKTGLILSCYTDRIGVQFYTGNNLRGDTPPGKGGIVFPRRSGFCLETQFFPNAPANPAFPQPILAMDELFTAEAVYKIDSV
ncbi:aldose epimerase family protein [Selenomonas artemidis]|uniref:aldose epimerase family protein n=1 Tax=Selenomonas artemidis TaxID=671224 RepID=UPI000426B202|nr:aldose epimerase family protein [Selenomonas artemidis]